MDNQGAPYEGIDFEKLLAVVKKSLIWLALIFIITNLTAYLIIRWTKPLYESHSELKLDVETNATELGLTTIGENQNLNVISSEIELLTSKLFLNKVIDNFPLEISYYTVGNVLNDEKFLSAPFKVNYTIKSDQIYDRRIRVDFVGENAFNLSFNEDDEGKTYQFGELIETPYADLLLEKTSYYPGYEENLHFFQINSRNALISYLSNNLSVVPLNLNANTIKISFTDHHPVKARDLVNAIDSLYLNYSQEEKSLENIQKINWLNTELKAIENQLEGFEDYFETFTIENRTSNLDADLEKTIQFINAIDSQRYELSKKINSTKALVTKLKTGNTANIAQGYYTDLPPSIRESIDEYVEVLKQYERLKLTYTESTFALTRKETELKTLKNTIESQLSSLANNYEDTMKELERRKIQLQQNFVELPGKSTEYNKKQRFFNLYEEFYLSLMQSKAEYQIAQAGTTTEFKILSAATLPYSPISPDKLIIHGIGIVAGLVFGFFFIGIRYLLHDKVATPQELERLTDAPILGYVPEEKQRMENSVLMVDQRPRSAVSESLRSIRTNIDFMVNNAVQRVISVTSTIGGEGKTFVAVNLGAIIAMSNKRVVVLDLDMRKPRVHLSFGNENEEKGVSTILINKHSLDECIKKTRVDNLHYINAGPTPPNPSELLLSKAFDDLLSRLKAEYDVVILDTPPVGIVTDGILAMKKASLAVYVLRANYSKRIFIKTLNRLRSINKFDNMAVVLNALPHLRSNNYGYGYGYYDTENSVVNKILNR